MLRFSTFLCVLTAVQCIQIHHHLTAEEVWNVFRSTHDKVPEHDVVPVVHTFSNNLIQTSPSTVKIKAFGNDVELYLQPVEGILIGKDVPMWTMKSNSSEPFGVEYKPILNATINKAVYEDLDKLATVTVKRDHRGNVLFDGIMGDTLIIRPLPTRVINDIMNSINNTLTKVLKSANTTFGENTWRTYHHIIIKKDMVMKKNFSMPKMGEGYKFTQKYTTNLQRQRRYASSVPEIVYPEILLVIEYKEFMLTGGNIKDAIEYIVTFWHAVDLRFRRLENPKIRLNIVGIILAEDPDSVFYVKKNELLKKHVNIDKALSDMGTYFAHEDRFEFIDDYDIVLTMTGYDLCSYDSNEIFTDFCDPVPLGQSYQSGACVKFIDRNGKSFIESVGIMEDNGGYSGIIPTAHEVGHLFGSFHDNVHDCNEGYIMSSAFTMTPNSFFWSNCSIRQLRTYFNGPRSHCLFNAPEKREEYPRVLPGKYLSLDEQCRKANYVKTCPNLNEEEVCVRLMCLMNGTTDVCHFEAPAAEGSPCATNKICLDGKCVPDFTLKLKNRASKQERARKPYYRSYTSRSVSRIVVNNVRA